jgi:hypothetical protein
MLKEKWKLEKEKSLNCTYANFKLSQQGVHPKQLCPILCPPTINNDSKWRQINEFLKQPKGTVNQRDNQ